MAVEARRTSWAVLIVSGLLAVLFLFAGGTKLAGIEMHVEHFAKWGYPDWFRVVVGAIEVAGALALFVPPLAFYGALLLTINMVGAILTHLTHNEASQAPFAAVVLVLAAYVAYARWRQGAKSASRVQTA